MWLQIASGVTPTEYGYTQFRSMSYLWYIYCTHSPKRDRIPVPIIGNRSLYQHGLPLKKAKKEGELPLPILGLIPSLNSIFLHFLLFLCFLRVGVGQTMTKSHLVFREKLFVFLFLPVVFEQPFFQSFQPLSACLKHIFRSDWQTNRLTERIA